MKITETHKDFGGGMKGRVSVFGDDGVLIAAILTPVQKARAFCERTPCSPEGAQFAAAVALASGDANVSVDLCRQALDAGPTDAEIAAMGDVDPYDLVTCSFCDNEFTLDSAHHDGWALGFERADGSGSANACPACAEQHGVFFDEDETCWVQAGCHVDATGTTIVDRTAPAALVLTTVPPTLEGKNPNNSALVSARKKLQALFAAASGADPISAVTAIHTSRGNTYINACDDYKKGLLRILGAQL